MARIRVLVVDDSAIMRRLLVKLLSADSALEVVGTAENGLIALQLIARLQPDVVTLDVEMPEMDGLTTLSRVRQTNPRLPVIMCSLLTGRGASVTIEALTRGASDYVTKAVGGSSDGAWERFGRELLPKIKQFQPTAAPMVRKVAAPPAESRPTLRSRRSLIVIGVSTGGPQALAAFVPLLPADLSVPICIVQHMPAMFTRLLAERLQQFTQLRVVEGAEGMKVEPRQIIIAPGDRHMRIVRRGTGLQIALDQTPPENGCRPAADVLFRSAAEACGSAVIAAVLTGMGHDGLSGVRQLKGLGAYVLAQDEATSVVWGMPGAVAQAGLADAVLPLPDLARDLIRQVRP